jgi:hypothetical protein
MVDAQAGKDRDQEGSWRVDFMEGSLPPAEKGLLHHVLGVGHASQHAVGDREEKSAMLLEN